MTPQHQIVKIESVKVWVTRLPSLSHLPLSMWRHRVTCRPPKNARAPWGGPGSWWLTIMIWQVSDIQYLLACQKSQRSTPYNSVKSGLPWKRVFRRRHLGRRVTAVTCLRWPTVQVIPSYCALMCSTWGVNWKVMKPPSTLAIRNAANGDLIHSWVPLNGMTMHPDENRSACLSSQIARFMGPTWGPPGSCRPQMGPMLAPWTLL